MSFRNVAEGSARGWGLHHSTLGHEISRDELYQLAYERAKARTLVDEERLKNFFLIVRDGLHDLESRNVIEFGSYRGGTAIFMATLMKELYPSAKFYALDSYEGMPETDSAIDLHGPEVQRRSGSSILSSANMSRIVRPLRPAPSGPLAPPVGPKRGSRSGGFPRRGA